MSYPTSAKPTTNFVEQLTTAGQVGADMQCFCPMLANGAHRDIVGNIIAVPASGPVPVGSGGGGGLSGGSGHPPAINPTGFNYSGVTDCTWKFGCGTAGISFKGRGWTSLVNNRSFGILCKPVSFVSGTAKTIPLLGNGRDGFFHGIGLSISTAGVITLGRYYGGSVTSSTVTLTSGHWVYITLTHVTSTSCLVNVYDFDAGAYLTPSGTGTTFSVTAPAVSNGDAVLNPGVNFDALGNIGFIGEVHSFWLSNDTFDPAQNGYFAALLADPSGPARGSYTGTGTLTPGGITDWDSTTTTITVNSNRPTGGVAGDQDRYQYALYRSTFANFTPSPANQVVGWQASPQLIDTTAVPGVNYFYQVGQTDGTSTVYSGTSTTNYQQVGGRLSRGDIFVALMCDSRFSSSGFGGPGSLIRYWRALGFRCGVIDFGAGGTSVYNNGNNTLSWQPSTTGSFSDPVNGQAGTVLLANLLVGAQQCGNINIIYSNLGVNDDPNSPATWITRYGYIKTQVLAAGFKLILEAPYLYLATTPANQWIIQQFQTLIANMDNGSTVRVVHPASNEFAFVGMAALSEDGLHMNDAGITGIAAARAIATLFGDNGPAQLTFDE